MQHMLKPSTRTAALTIILSFLLLAPPAQAGIMQDDNYRIEFDKTAIFSNPTPKIASPSSMTSRSLSKDAHERTSLSFTVSENIIDFGILTGTNPVTRSNTITLKTTNTTGSVFAQFDHDLASSETTIIPQTTCDGGACDTKTAAIWTSSLAFGYGYHCSDEQGKGCDASFADTSFFKQFPINSAKQNPILLAQSTQTEAKKTMLYKINISTSQIPGYYSNTLTYVAVPSY